MRVYPFVFAPRVEARSIQAIPTGSSNNVPLPPPGVHGKGLVDFQPDNKLPDALHQWFVNQSDVADAPKSYRIRCLHPLLGLLHIVLDR